MWTLGISAFRDDAAAALLHDGCIVGIAEEERFLRIKHAVLEPPRGFITSFSESEQMDEFELRYFPYRAVEYLLKEAEISETDVDVIAYDLDLKHRLDTWTRFLPLAREWDELRQRQERDSIRYWQRLLEAFALRCGAKLEYIRHHEAHAAGAVFASGIAKTAFLIVDGMGEMDTTTYGSFDGAFHVHGKVFLPHSLGFAYAALTSFLGFRPFSAEQKTMGLAAYGDPHVFESWASNLMRPTVGGFEIDVDRVWTRGLKMGNAGDPARLFDQAKPRESASDPTRSPWADLAAAAQARLVLLMNHLVDLALMSSHERTLCLGGGVALNCSANGSLLSRDDLDELFVQPQAGDAGTALGAAYLSFFRATGSRPEAMHSAYWGPSFRGSEVCDLLERLRLPFRVSDDPARDAARMIADRKIVGWFQGRAECGPRALGNRSLLAHPTNREMRAKVNAVVKDRELWRPFAASILDERRSEYLAHDVESPYMLLTIGLSKSGQQDLAAACHADGTTRPQTVSAVSNPRYHRLLQEFEDLTGIGGVLNTSLNGKDEPIANDPLDAIKLFASSGMDALVIERCILEKGAMGAALRP